MTRKLSSREGQAVTLDSLERVAPLFSKRETGCLAQVSARAPRPSLYVPLVSHCGPVGNGSSSSSVDDRSSLSRRRHDTLCLPRMLRDAVPCDATPAGKKERGGFISSAFFLISARRQTETGSGFRNATPAEPLAQATHRTLPESETARAAALSHSP